jgi:hypothetical protein
MSAHVLARVAALPSQENDELKQLWRELFDEPAPPKPRGYLIPRLAWRIQELAYGGLSTDAQKRIDRLVRTKEPIKPSGQRIKRPAIGTRLIREYQGVEHQVTFVSVTQQFNTTTSMGRLTLNILLSFAQFEREVTGERIRDKIALSKQKGLWMGGPVPLGYIGWSSASWSLSRRKHSWSSAFSYASSRWAHPPRSAGNSTPRVFAPSHGARARVR